MIYAGHVLQSLYAGRRKFSFFILGNSKFGNPVRIVQYGTYGRIGQCTTGLNDSYSTGTVRYRTVPYSTEIRILVL